MKEEYVTPEVEIVEIDETDIIFASGESCAETSNLGDGC